MLILIVKKIYTLQMLVLFTLISFYNNSKANTSTFYVGTTKGGGIFYSNLNTQTGELSSFKLAATLNRPSFIALDTKKNFLFSTDLYSWKNPGEVISFKIQKNFKLKEINRVSSMGINPCHISLNPKKNILLVSNYNGPISVTSHSISTNGLLSNAISFREHFGNGVHSERQKKPHAHSIFSHPFYPFVYAADLGSEAIFIYKLEQKTGELSFIKKEILNGQSMGPRHMKWDKKGKFLYVLNELTPSISIFKYISNGYIKEVKKVNALPKHIDKNGLTAAEIRIHPFKPIIYTSIRDLNNEGRNFISIFKASGSSSRLIKTISAKVEFPRNFNIDPSGNWMLVAGQRSKNIAVLPINQNGIPEDKNLLYEFPGEPVCIEFLD